MEDNAKEREGERGRRLGSGKMRIKEKGQRGERRATEEERRIKLEKERK